MSVGRGWRHQRGGGIYQTMMNKMITRGDKLEEGEVHPPVYTKDGFSKPRWLGPGSKFEEKIKQGLPPVVPVDRVARVHDARYSRVMSADDVRDADERMVRRLKKMWNNGEDYKFNIAIAALPIMAKMKLEDAGIFAADKFAPYGGTAEDPEMIDDFIKRETQAGYGMRNRRRTHACGV
jgi:hypothetical protein